MDGEKYRMRCKLVHTTFEANSMRAMKSRPVSWKLTCWCRHVAASDDPSPLPPGRRLLHECAEWAGLFLRVHMTGCASRDHCACR